MVDAANFVRSRTKLAPRVAVVLGSGLGAFAGTLEGAVRIPYAQLAGMPISTAVGHIGELVAGSINGTAVLVMSGRFHLYEGYSAKEVTAGIRLFRELGVKRVVLTNAAGGINPLYATGALVAISDHINLQGVNPLVGPNDPKLGPRFPDMTQAYSKSLRTQAQQCAATLGFTLHEGVYAALLGPSYETPAEIRYLRTIGADLVGMSTVAEAIAANHMGMEVLGVSCVTNVAAGLSDKKLNHEEVLEIGRRVAGTFIKLLEKVVPQLAE